MSTRKAQVLLENDNWVEEEGTGGVDAARGGIGGILGTRNVLCVYHSAVIFHKLDDMLENIVGWPVGTALLPLALCGDSLLNAVESPVNTRNRGKMTDWQEDRGYKED